MRYRKGPVVWIWLNTSHYIKKKKTCSTPSFSPYNMFPTRFYKAVIPLEMISWVKKNLYMVLVKNSHPKVFCRMTVLKNFTINRRKTLVSKSLPWETPAQMFSSDFYKIFLKILKLKCSENWKIIGKNFLVKIASRKVTGSSHLLQPH